MKNFIFLVLLLFSLNSYTQNNNSGIDICIALNGFNSSSEANDALDRILSTIGVSKNFVMQECSNVSNASALQVEGVRYIFYNPQWMRNVNNKTSYGGLFTLAHEVGHHINGHALDWILYATESVNSKTLSERRAQELEADEFAGFVLAKLGASLNETTAVIRGSVDNSDDTYSTHPSLDKRLVSIKKGYLNGSGGVDTSNDYSTKPTTDNVIFYNDGSRWEGEIKPSEIYYRTNEQGHVLGGRTSKKAHGYGIMYEKDGSVFKGVFYNGAANGYGEKYYTDGSTFKGQYVDGRKTGKGNWVVPYGATGICWGGYTDDKDRGICWSNFTFEGFFENGYPSGKGKLISTFEGKKTIYDGQWDKWILNGIGKITFADGEIWEGNLFERSLEGYGTKTLPNGKKISGMWGSESYYEKAEAQYSDGNYKAAIINYTKAIEMDPNDYMAFSNRGLTKYNLKDYAGAIADLTKAIDIEPNTSFNYNNRGLAKENLKDYAGAIKDFTKAIDIEPTKRAYVKNRGDSKFELSDYLGAINDYDKAIEIESDHISSYHARGGAKFGLDDYTGAIADFTKAIDLGLNEASVFSYRGLAKENLKDYAGAIKDFTKAIALNPSKESYYFERGSSKSNIKDYYGAIADFTKAIEINPNESQTYRTRAVHYYQIQNYQAAKVDITKAIELEPNVAFAHFASAWNNYKLGDLSNACRDIKKAIELSPDEYNSDEYNIDNEIYKLVCN